MPQIHNRIIPQIPIELKEVWIITVTEYNRVSHLEIKERTLSRDYVTWLDGIPSQDLFLNSYFGQLTMLRN